MEREKGAYALLQSASVYSWFQSAVAPARYHRFILEQMNTKIGDRVFDIGCGPGDILETLPQVEYLGIDYSQEYIDAAQTNYGDRARFVCAGVDDAELGDEAGTFDIAAAKGVVHHLDDKLATDLFRVAREALKPGGRLMTIDPCFADGQSWFSKQVVSRDRGEFVRTLDAYRDLAAPFFSEVKTTVRHDLLRIPYTHLCMVCTA